MGVSMYDKGYTGVVGDMICSDCGAEMTKSKIQCEDMSGWMMGWLCDCDPDGEFDEPLLTVWSEKDWTAEQMIEAMKEEA